MIRPSSARPSGARVEGARAVVVPKRQKRRRRHPPRQRLRADPLPQARRRPELRPAQQPGSVRSQARARPAGAPQGQGRHGGCCFRGVCVCVCVFPEPEALFSSARCDRKGETLVLFYSVGACVRFVERCGARSGCPRRRDRWGENSDSFVPCRGVVRQQCGGFFKGCLPAVESDMASRDGFKPWSEP